MVKIALFRRRSRASETLKRLETADVTDESSRSGATLVSVASKCQPPSSPSSSSRWNVRSSLTSSTSGKENNNNKKKKKPGVRFARSTKVYRHHTRFDNDIIHRVLWWTPQELHTLLSHEMKLLTSVEDIKLKQYPSVVQEWAHMTDRFYHQPQDPSKTKDRLVSPVEQDIHASLDATRDWRGLEEYMVDQRHHQRVEEHVVTLVLLQKTRSHQYAVPPSSTSIKATRLAHLRACHDAQQVQEDDEKAPQKD
eukprot:scaffold1139_cov174-Amphora_coffeaeformis.AAC.5